MLRVLKFIFRLVFIYVFTANWHELSVMTYTLPFTIRVYQYVNAKHVHERMTQILILTGCPIVELRLGRRLCSTMRNSSEPVLDAFDPTPR
jgi:hypothetical protein